MRLFPSAGGARWAPRLLSVLLFALLCAVVAYWALRLFEPPVRVAPSGSLAATGAVASLGPAHTLFGRTGTNDGPVVQAISSSFKVLGVIADTERGAAVISVEGRPAEAFGVGMRIDDNHRLKTVTATEVVILRGDEEIRVEAPALTDIAILTAGPASGAASAPDSRPAPPMRPLPPAGAAAAVPEQAAPRPVVRRPTSDPRPQIPGEQPAPPAENAR